MMDGSTLAVMQETIGVRKIVEDIDALRMMLGFDNVAVLTPKVEIRLRSAEKPAIPMKVLCSICYKDSSSRLLLTFPQGYPNDSLVSEVTSSDGAILELMTEKLQQYCSALSSESEMSFTIEQPQIYRRAPMVVCYLRQLLEDESILSSPIDLTATGIQIDDIKPDLITTNDEIGSLSESADCRNEEADTEEDDKFYSCMVCGSFLFSDSEVEKHTPTQKDFDRRGGKILQCSSVFISSLPKFMDDSKVTDNTVKIACPKCAGKLGLISWTGSQCSCGAWITPAIQFINSKVDAKRKNFDILAYTNLKSSTPIIIR
jgi:dual specificity phosphatase 12